MNPALSAVETRLARYLAKPVHVHAHVHNAAPPTSPERLLAVLRPADLLLVEGHSRFSTAIKYLTQSTWSHAALYVGEHLREAGACAEHCFVEADVVDGVRSLGVDEFAAYHTRICRPVGLDDATCRRVTGYAIARIGSSYDLRNIIDLMRYLVPTPPVPSYLRRRMLAFGSGGPDTGHLFDADRTGIPIGPVSDPADRRTWRSQHAEVPGLLRGSVTHPPNQSVRAARFRRVALFPDHKAHARAGLRLPVAALG